MKLGATIRELRNEKKLTQKDLGKIIGVSQKTISSWERGSKLPDIPTLVRIAQYFCVSTDYLIGLVDY